jgi:hypothetical protein
MVFFVLLIGCQDREQYEVSKNFGKSALSENSKPIETKSMEEEEYKNLLKLRISEKGSKIFPQGATSDHSSQDISAEPDIEGLLQGISFIEELPENLDEEMVSIGNEEDEEGPFVRIDSGSGKYTIIDRVIPVSEDYVERDTTEEDIAFFDDIYEHLDKIGIKDEKDVKIASSSMMATELIFNDDGTKTENRYEMERAFQVNRKVNGLGVRGNRFNISYHLDDRLRYLNGRWDYIDYKNSQLVSNLGKEEVIDAALEEMIKQEVNPYDEGIISIFTCYYVDRTNPEDLVLDMKAEMAVIEGNDDVNYSTKYYIIDI